MKEIRFIHKTFLDYDICMAINYENKTGVMCQIQKNIFSIEPCACCMNSSDRRKIDVAVKEIIATLEIKVFWIGDGCKPAQFAEFSAGIYGDTNAYLLFREIKLYSLLQLQEIENNLTSSWAEAVKKYLAQKIT